MESLSVLITRGVGSYHVPWIHNRCKKYRSIKYQIARNNVLRQRLGVCEKIQPDGSLQLN